MPHPAGRVVALLTTGLCLGASVSSLLCEKRSGNKVIWIYARARPRSSPQSFKAYDVRREREKIFNVAADDPLLGVVRFLISCCSFSGYRLITVA
jgi:hypothetical protein